MWSVFNCVRSRQYVGIICIPVGGTHRCIGHQRGVKLQPAAQRHTNFCCSSETLIHSLSRDKIHYRLFSLNSMENRAQLSWHVQDIAVNSIDMWMTTKRNFIEFESQVIFIFRGWKLSVITCVYSVALYYESDADPRFLEVWDVYDFS